MAGYEGFAALGDIVSGGANRRAEKEFVPQLKRNYDAFGALEVARKHRAEAIAEDLKAQARGRAPDAYKAYAAEQGWSPELGELGGAFAQGGNLNFNEFMGGTQKGADLELDRQISEALTKGDQTTARNLSAVKTDKVLPQLGTSGRTVFTPSTGDVALTPLGDAALGEIDAKTEAAQARAVATGVTANAADIRARAYEADKLRGTPGAMGYTAEDADEFKAAFLADNGRLPTDDEIATVLSGNAIKISPLGGEILEPARPTVNAFGNVVAPPATTKPGGKISGPQVGAIMDGYRYKGGDPASPASWEKI